MTRWIVQNIDYDYAKGNPARLRRIAHNDQPWEAYTRHHGVHGQTVHAQTFATHAEAITYADKQARRTA